MTNADQQPKKVFEMYRSMPRHPLPVTVLVPRIIRFHNISTFGAVCDRFYLALNLDCDAI